MKQLAINGALYGLPGIIVLTMFSAGHLSISPTSSVLPPAPVDISEDKPLEPEAAVDEEAQAEAGVFSKPGYQYYPYPATVMGNVPNSSQLFSFELAVSIFDTPLNASKLMTTLEEREPQLRPIILEQATDLDAETLLSTEGRKLLIKNIKASMNSSLIKWGYEPFIHSVELTSFLIT